MDEEERGETRRPSRIPMAGFAPTLRLARARWVIGIAYYGSMGSMGTRTLASRAHRFARSDGNWLLLVRSQSFSFIFISTLFPLSFSCRTSSQSISE